MRVTASGTANLATLAERVRPAAAQPHLRRSPTGSSPRNRARDAVELDDRVEPQGRQLEFRRRSASGRGDGAASHRAARGRRARARGHADGRLPQQPARDRASRCSPRRRGSVDRALLLLGRRVRARRRADRPGSGCAARSPTSTSTSGSRSMRRSQPKRRAGDGAKARRARAQRRRRRGRAPRRLRARAARPQGRAPRARTATGACASPAASRGHRDVARPAPGAAQRPRDGAPGALRAARTRRAAPVRSEIDANEKAEEHLARARHRRPTRSSREAATTSASSSSSRSPSGPTGASASWRSSIRPGASTATAGGASAARGRRPSSRVQLDDRGRRRVPRALRLSGGGAQRADQDQRQPQVDGRAQRLRLSVARRQAHAAHGRRPVHQDRSGHRQAARRAVAAGAAAAHHARLPRRVQRRLRVRRRHTATSRSRRD